ncbi:hypothetical protein KAJ27_17635, partial [bacterium]|nr:hypothetical protein [bacterium]
MDNEIIQAYLWQDIIRLGFSPSSDKDKKDWLVQYGNSLKDFWEIDEYPVKNDEITKFTIIHAGLNFEYTFSKSISTSKFAISLYYLSDKIELMWVHDVDSQYFGFPEQSILNKYGKKNQISDTDISRHIKIILDGLLFHPRVHQHIQSPINNHEIRIGGGISNPFLFLFHLRYQLCPDITAKNSEKNRLIQLFENAIKNNRAITMNEL